MLFEGDSDEAVWKLVKELGWEAELKGVMAKSHAELKAAWGMKEEEPKSVADADAETLAERLASHSISDK